MTSTTLSSSSSSEEIMTNNNKKPFISVAHIGNSIQYYNDCPRLLMNLLKVTYVDVTQDSCLRGGASLVTLPIKGNGMNHKFHTPPALRIQDGTYDIGSPTITSLLNRNGNNNNYNNYKNWDVIILNDHTQAPARETSRSKSIRVLQSTYLPQFRRQTRDPSSSSSSTKNPTIIFLMTAAYRSPVSGSEDLGSFDDFTMKIKNGYEEYQKCIPGSKIAPVGLAYQYLYRHHRMVWERLYARDDFHPSPHGTLLEAYVLYVTITDTPPPTTYSEDWWKMARYMQPPEVKPLPIPTKEEALFLRDIASRVCGGAV